jgi:hypothetical protein
MAAAVKALVAGVADAGLGLIQLQTQALHCIPGPDQGRFGFAATQNAKVIGIVDIDRTSKRL